MKHLQQTEGAGKAGVNLHRRHGAGSVEHATGSHRTFKWILLDLIPVDSAVCGRVASGFPLGVVSLAVNSRPSRGFSGRGSRVSTAIRFEDASLRVYSRARSPARRLLRRCGHEGRHSSPRTRSHLHFPPGRYGKSQM